MKGKYHSGRLQNETIIQRRYKTKIYPNTCSAMARSFAASVASSSKTAAMVVDEEMAESRSIGGGGNVRCSSAKDTWNQVYEYTFA